MTTFADSFFIVNTARVNDYALDLTFPNFAPAQMIVMIIEIDSSNSVT